MRLQCSVLVSNAAGVSGTHRRYSKGILLLEHGNAKEVGKCNLVLITPQRRNGQVFRLSRCNTKRIHSAYLHRGRITIEMNEPSVMIHIKEASPPSLRRFLTKLRDVLEGKMVALSENKKVTANDFAALQQKLVISSKEQYLAHKSGFKTHLQVLILSNIGLSTVDTRWFEATSLQRLDLSGNKLGRGETFNTKFLNIARLPRLRVLILAENEIKFISDALWNSLRENLQFLDLSNNLLTCLPACSTRFPHMTHLLLRQNRIEQLPQSINEMSSLRYLDISWNRLKFLPSEIMDLRIEVIDITNYSGEESQSFEKLWQLCETVKSGVKVGSLFECAAAAVMNSRVNTNFLPEPLRSTMLQSLESCKCKGRYKFYPRSTVKITFRMVDIRSIAFTAISRSHHYDAVVRFVEKV